MLKVSQINTKLGYSLCCNYIKFIFLAVNATFDFKYGTTILPDLHVSNRTRISPPLCQTSNPEEKRKIIGDVFVKVLINIFI